MIKYTKGNLLDASADALVNTVNTVGVMGKGIALQFKTRFPNNYKIYRDACKSGEFKTGQLLVVEDRDLLHKKLIINFPTKAHWKASSTYEYIETGLVALKASIIDHKIKSIAIPPLGCGNGGLDWWRVKAMIEKELCDLECEITLYEPNDTIKSQLQNEVSSRPPKVVKLTPARAMLLYLMFGYESSGAQSSIFVANKLAYFLQRSGENLQLTFKAHRYGPFAVQVNHVLLALNGVYLTGMEQNTAGPFEHLSLNYDRFKEVEQFVEDQLNDEQRKRLEKVSSLLTRFESAYSLELLSTVDFIIEDTKKNQVAEVMNEVRKWSDRKSQLFEQKQVEIALNHLVDHSN
jgi:O-acetyl-ADP-ribose deacetylase (regulator of RNase III)